MVFNCSLPTETQNSIFSNRFKNQVENRENQ